MRTFSPFAWVAEFARITLRLRDMARLPARGPEVTGSKLGGRRNGNGQRAFVSWAFCCAVSPWLRSLRRQGHTAEFPPRHAR